MASRAKAQRDDEDALDPVEAADVEHGDDPDEGLLGLDPDAEDDDSDGPDDLDDGLSADDSDDEPALDGDVPAEEDDAPTSGVVLPDAAFDDDEDVATVVVDVDDDDETIEGVRDGEFVCRRCYMAKRETQLADAERLLCRDCA